MTMLMRPILNFDQLSVDQAYRVLHNEIVPICKKNGVKLSVYCATHSLGSIKKYNTEKQKSKLCNVEKVQKVFRLLDEEVVSSIHQSISLFSLRNIIKRDKGESITNGECIAAMLVKGYIADFVLDRGKFGVNCQFYIKLHQ